MNILLYKDLILNFIKPNLVDKECQKQIRRIIENENSIFIYSKRLFSFIENELGEEYKDEYQRLFTRFIDSSPSIKSSQSSQNFDDEMLHILSDVQNKYVVNISCNTPSQEIQSKIANIAILSQQQKLNYHWLVVNLAISNVNKVSVNCFDFGTNDEIRIFFGNIFRISKENSIINIFDRQTSTFKHNLFDVIRTKNKVKYFTFCNKNILLDLSNIKDFFKKVEIFTTRKKGITHGRRILFGNFIIISDNDFNNIDVDNDWTIDIQYNEENSQKWLSFSENYRRF